MTAPADHKRLAIYLAGALGGSPNVETFWDKPRRSSIDILSAADIPQRGLTSYATIGLCDFTTGLMSDGLPLRAELVMTLRSEDADAPAMLSTCAMDVINDQFVIRLGAIFQKVIELYRPELAMKDLFLVEPFIWPLEDQMFADKKVSWLSAVPISAAERNLARERGPDALDALLEAREAKVFDLERQSVI